jgi:hypothetical protein
MGLGANARFGAVVGILNGDEGESLAEGDLYVICGFRRDDEVIDAIEPASYTRMSAGHVAAELGTYRGEKWMVAWKRILSRLNHDRIIIPKR